MDKLIPSIVVWTLLGLGACQYDQGGRFHSNVPPPASILLHKQALGQDGSFNYAFAADNGLQQGEIINPDGSRKGSYSYVDPNGKTVTLSYTAGKDGFRVLNGDHVPRAPEQQQQQLQQQHFPHGQNLQHYQQQPQGQHLPYSHQEAPRYPLFRPNPIPYEAYRNAPNAPAYRGNYVPQGQLPPIPSPHAQYVGHQEAPYRQGLALRPVQQYQPRQYSVQEGNHDKPYNYLAHQYQGNQGQEEPRKPHSFGNGYAFEFAG